MCDIDGNSSPIYRDGGLLAKCDKQERKDMELKQQKDIVRAYANQDNLSEQKIKLILDYAYEESHSYGIQAVLETLDSLIDLIKKIEDL